MQFEPLEPQLGAKDPGLLRRIEEGFLHLRAALREPGAAVDPLVAEVHAGLTEAAAALATPAVAWALFAQSAAIILREGFEVVLILGALIAYVVKSGSAAMKRPIYGGAVGGVVASIATAALLVTVFQLTPGASDVLEGVAMLLAAAVLFWVSYWIISKAEAERWHRYIRGKVDRGLAAGSGTALAAAAFLAVYREGFETVLFYQALLAGAPRGDVMVPAGLVAGSTLLGVVFLVLARFGLRIPLRPFFLATGVFLNYLAVAFAGRGVHELQEAGVIAVTRVPWVPELGMLGLFPTRETLLAQGILIVLLAYAMFVTLRRRPGIAESDQLRAEVRRLRALAEAMREEVRGLRAVSEATSLGARLDGLLGEVEAVERRATPGNGHR
jgi:high-affinity iron transporter